MEAPDDFPFDVSFNTTSDGTIIIFSAGQSNVSYRNYHKKEVYDDVNNITTIYRCYAEKTETSMSFLIGTLDKKKIIFLNGNGWTDDEQKMDFLDSYKELPKHDKNLIISFIIGL
jgi:hypothetical protein